MNLLHIRLRRWKCFRRKFSHRRKCPLLLLLHTTYVQVSEVHSERLMPVLISIPLAAISSSASSKVCTSNTCGVDPVCVRIVAHIWSVIWQIHRVAPVIVRHISRRKFTALLACSFACLLIVSFQLCRLDGRGSTEGLFRTDDTMGRYVGHLLWVADLVARVVKTLELELDRIFTRLQNTGDSRSVRFSNSFAVPACAYVSIKA